MKRFELFLCLWQLTILPLVGQHSLEKEFEEIAGSIKGKLGISVLHLESGEAVSFNGDQPFPMQSVYKFPIAMVMLKQVDSGRFSLEDSITISKEEYIPKEGYSPLRDQFPGGTRLTLAEILEYNVSKSDGTACDVLIRLLGGTQMVQKHLVAAGVKNIAIATTEMVQVANDTIQYQNWATPTAMTELFRFFWQTDFLSIKSQQFLSALLNVSGKWFDSRIKGLLPAETTVLHKTGSSRTYQGLTRATNDAGIIFLPDGSHLAITVFLADCKEPQEVRERTIAKVARLAYDYWR